MEVDQATQVLLINTCPDLHSLLSAHTFPISIILLQELFFFSSLEDKIFYFWKKKMCTGRFIQAEKLK